MSTTAEVERVVADALQAVLGRTVRPGEQVVRSREGGWDSLRHVELIFSIEAALGIQFDAEELAALDTSTALVERAHHRLSNPSP